MISIPMSQHKVKRHNFVLVKIQQQQKKTCFKLLKLCNQNFCHGKVILPWSILSSVLQTKVHENQQANIIATVFKQW